MNNFWLYYIIGAGILYVSVFVLVIFRKTLKRTFYKIFYRARYLEAIILHKNNQIVFIPVKEEQKNFSYKGGMYNIEDKCFFYLKSIPYIFYFKDNPNPLLISENLIKKTSFEIDATTQNDIVSNKIVRYIIAENNDLTLIKIIVIAIALMLLGYILYSTGALDQLFNGVAGVSENIATKVPATR